MIEEMIAHRCEKCASTDIHRNGRDKRDGRQKYYCKGCWHHGRLRDLQTPLSADEVRAQAPKEYRLTEVYKAALERCSLRGLGRIFGIGRDTVMHLFKQAISKLKKLKDMVSPAQPGEVVEVDEMWSFVGNKGEVCWIWTAICRRTREIIAFAIGDRSSKTARTLWRHIPDSYKNFQKPAMMQLAKKRGKPHTWNDGTLPHASVTHALSENHSLSPSAASTTISI
jgi:insertion element IS1 protein InsB